MTNRHKTQKFGSSEGGGKPVQMFFYTDETWARKSRVTWKAIQKRDRKASLYIH